MTPACGLALKNLYNSDTQIYTVMTDYEVTFANNEELKSITTTTASPSQGGEPRGVINGYPTQSPTYTVHNLIGLVLNKSNHVASARRQSGATETGKYKFTVLSA